MIQFLPRPFFRLLKPPWSVIELNGHCYLRWQIKTKHVLLIKLQVFRVLLAAWVKRLDQTFVRYAIEKSAAVGFWLDNAAAEGGVPLIWKMYARFDAIHALWRVFESFYKKNEHKLGYLSLSNLESIFNMNRSWLCVTTVQVAKAKTDNHSQKGCVSAL